MSSHISSINIADLSVYALCSSPLLVDFSGGLLNVLRHIPVVAYFTNTFARQTFFRQVSPISGYLT